MRISVAEAEGRLSELADRAERGEEVVLTREGHASFQLVRLARSPLPPEERLKVLEAIRKKATPWSPEFETDAARSQDFLYDEFGLPK